jgi:hypothetical protein
MRGRPDDGQRVDVSRERREQRDEGAGVYPAWASPCLPYGSMLSPVQGSGSIVVSQKEATSRLHGKSTREAASQRLLRLGSRRVCRCAVEIFRHEFVHLQKYRQSHLLVLTVLGIEMPVPAIELRQALAISLTSVSLLSALSSKARLPTIEIAAALPCEQKNGVGTHSHRC